MDTVASWYVSLLALTLPGSLLVWRWFPASLDRGWAVGKLIGLLVAAGLAWLAASWLRLPADRGLAVAVTLVVLLLALAANRGHWSDLLDWLRRRWALVAGIELLLLAGLVFWAGVRSFDPAASTTEKPMELLFFTAVTRGGTAFPPPDNWMAGLGISYYYLGYLVFGLPAMLGAVAPAVGFTLALATVAAISGILVVGLACAVPRVARWAVAVAAGMGVLLIGNLFGVIEFLRATRLAPAALLEWVGVKGADTLPASATVLPAEYWWWWRGTRLIDTQRGGASLDYTITEFPLFSLVLGDLHPHVMGLPLLLTAIILTAAIIVRPPTGRVRWLVAAAIGGFGGLVALVNPWDAPTVLLLLVAALVLRTRPGWRAAAATAALALVVAVVPFIPFYLAFATQASGIGVWTGPGTRPLHWLLIWGVFLVPLTAWIIAAARHAGVSRGWVALALLGPLGLWLVVELGLLLGNGVLAQAIVARSWWLAPLVLLAAIGRSVWREGTPVERLIWCLVSLGLLLQAATELFFIRDAFGSRMNTVFKAYYQTWILWASAAALVIGRWAWQRARRPAWSWAPAAATAALALAAFYYGAGAMYSRTIELGAPRGLDALAFLDEQRPGERAAAAWLAMQPGDSVILEAVGNDYGPSGRMAMASGRPTVLGWPGHQRQWRGDDPRIADRERDVDAIFRAADLTAARPLLERYGVEYVVVGDLERSQYGAGVAKFAGLPVAFRSGGVTVYRVS